MSFSVSSVNFCSIKVRIPLKPIVQIRKCKTGVSGVGSHQINCNQNINVQAAAKGADKVCTDLRGSLPLMNIPICTAANNPANGNKLGTNIPEITCTIPAFETVELKL